MKKVSIAVFALLLVGCATLSLDTVTNAFKAKQSLDTVAVMVVDCVKGTPVEQKIADSFNYLIDLKEATKEMQPDAEALKAILGGKETIDKAGAAWNHVKVEIRTAGLTCNPALPNAASNVEKSYNDIVDAIESDERIVTALEWGTLLAGMVAGPQGAAVVKLAAVAAK